MPTISELKKALAKPGDGPAAVVRDLEAERKRTASIITWAAEKDRAPLEMRDLLIEMNNQIAQMRIEEARRAAAARVRDSWLLGLTATILVLTAVLVAAEIFVR
jgi:hypothetical protein